MIKAVVLDIDGIIVGEKIGFNSPYPHRDVMIGMRNIHKKGIPISLCTAKPYYAIEKIIKESSLNNPHITDGGAVIIDPIDNIVLAKHVIDKEIAAQVVKVCLENDIYIEFHAIDNYYIQKNQVSDITNKHRHILQREAKRVDSLLDFALNNEAVVLMPVAKDPEDKKRVSKIFENFDRKLSITWGIHPIVLPLQFCIVTALGNSKKEAVLELSKKLKTTLDQILAVGDSQTDWKFIEMCGYGATLANGSEEIKSLVKTKGTGKYFIGKSVDDNGILDVFKYFNL